jgi:GTP-binding protein HflX
LERDLKAISARRQNQRKARHRSPFSVVSIVGYTNAGKSTLLRALTGADVKVEDQLFATVDPTTRRLRLPGGEQILLTDTVGFVKKLPHTLVEAFKSTLEVAASADLLVHVVDGAGPDPDARIIAVQQVLESIDAGHVEQLLVFNKLDASEEVKRLVDLNPGSVGISAQTGEGLNDLLLAIGARLRSTSEVFELAIPFSRGDIVASLHREGEVLTENTDADGMRYSARLAPDSASRLEEWIVRS